MEGCSQFSILDITLIPLLLFFYCRAPVQRIADTALLMNAYGRDGDTWKRRMLRQYWQPPAIVAGTLVTLVVLLLSFKLPSSLRDDLGDIALALLYVLFAMIPLWPLVFCIRANRAYSRLEAWREMQIEHRIAAGMATPADYYGYIQNVKEREYNRGYSAGRMMRR